MAEFACPEPLENVAYLYDGTLEGLLTAVFAAYERHERPADVVCEWQYEPRLAQSCIFIETDACKADRVRHGLCRACGRRAFTAVVRASTCEGPDVGTVVYRFISYAMAREKVLDASGMHSSHAGARRARRRGCILDELAVPEVRDLAQLEKHAISECEKVRQFVRFSHLENGVWFAKVRPNASVVPLVMGYFASRLNDQPFIIYDAAHHLAGVYDTMRWHLVAGDAVDVPRATEHDDLMQRAWTRFYDTLAIDARYNPELRRRFMPVRLWQDLPEMAPRTQ